MSQKRSHLEEIDMIGKLADLKEGHYNITLIVNAMIELLIEKDIITREEIANKAEQLDRINPDLNHPMV